MKKTFALIAALIGFNVSAQEYTHQIIVVNEGYFDYQTNEILTPVTLGSFNPESNVYTVMDTIEGMRFASDALISGDELFVASDTKILKYDVNSFELIQEVSYPGVRNLGLFNNYLVATRGEYMTVYDSYLSVFNANDLSLVQEFDTINGPKWATQNIVVTNGVAYIAVNNAYEWGNEKGIVGQLDLTSMSYGNELSLGENGKNPDNMFLSGDYLYTVNNKDWSGASVSKIALNPNSVQTLDIANAITGCGTSALRDNKLIYQISMETSLNEYDLNGMNNLGPINNHVLNYYALAQNPVDGLLYTSETDFFSYGTIHVFSNENVEINSFEASVSPGIILFDNRPLNNVLSAQENNPLYAWPNPASELMHFSGNTSSIQIYNTKGFELLKINDKSLDVSRLASGVYFARNEVGETIRFVVK